MRNKKEYSDHLDIIKISNASFGYSDNPIFKNINLETKEGELFCLMGCNGCGKSTLLNCILGIHALKEGCIHVSGHEISTYKAIELAKKVAYVPQVHERSFPFLVRQIILMGRTAYAGGFGAPGMIDEEIVENIMKETGIIHLADRPYTQISGGEMQMVALARALVQETPIIIMDEPTAHLDFYNELLFLEKVSSLVALGNRTIFMATHSPNQAFYLENQGISVRVGLMCDGSIYAVGRPGEVLTEENIANVYKIKTKIIYSNNLKQIVPVETIG